MEHIFNMARNRSAPRYEENGPEAEAIRPSRFDSLERKLDAVEDKLEDHWLEILTVVLLGVASLAAAWGGYQSARWGGVQSTLYTSAGAARVESTRAESKSQILALTDLSIVAECSESFDTEQQVVAALTAARPREDLRTAMENCYADRFSPELMTAMDAWFEPEPVLGLVETSGDPAISSSRPGGKIQVEDIIRQEHAQAELLESEAGRLFVEGQAANQQSDDYVLTTVFFAMVLFLGGISTRLKWPPLQIGFVGFATVLLALSLVRMASFPVH